MLFLIQDDDYHVIRTPTFAMATKCVDSETR